MKQTKHGDTFKRSFGLAVKSRRKVLGISQDELAWRAGVHRTYVTNVERGICNPSLVSISKIADALGTTTSDLLIEAEPEKNGAGKTSVTSVDILLVEDNATDAELTVETLKTAGIANTVHVASDGAEALNYIFNPENKERPNRPRLILLDLNMPKINGLEVLRRLKADKETASIPVVVLTISRTDEHIAECRRLGANAYVVKPVNFQRLIEVTPQLNLFWLLLQNPLSAAA